MADQDWLPSAAARKRSSSRASAACCSACWRSAGPRIGRGIFAGVLAKGLGLGREVIGDAAQPHVEGVGEEALEGSVSVA